MVMCYPKCKYKIIINPRLNITAAIDIVMKAVSIIETDNGL